ncbi:MAG TPA: DUF1697 domain-containing protein [Rhizomicrobium sp.]|nr:DUF1697 domain-containing protein [Rhizomicrobium sp.]
MAVVVLLRGVNVGGHRSFRPAKFVEQLAHLGAINIGATGAFVIKGRVGHAKLRSEIAARLPFEAEIMICDGRALSRLLAHTAFEGSAPVPTKCGLSACWRSVRPRCPGCR